MNKENIYITFPKESSHDEWVDSFTVNLIKVLGRVLDVKPSIYVKEKDFNYGNYKDYLLKSGIYVLVLGTAMDDEEGYAKEIEDIITNIESNKKDNEQCLKLLIAYQSFPKSDFTQKILTSVQTYNFYVPKGRNFSSYQALSFQADMHLIWAKLLDMAYDIKASLSYKGENEKFVYLGHCSSEQNLSRDEIKREIQRLGYRVIPGENLPSGKELITKLVVKGLQKSCFIVQILGGRYGSIVSGEKTSNYEIENKAIFNEIRNNPTLKRLIWISSDLKMNDQKQQLYISRIKRDESTINTEIVETNIEELKSLLVQELKNEGKTKDEQETKGIYYISNKKGDSGHIIDVAGNLGIEVFCREPHLDGGGYKKHLMDISKSEAILIDYTPQDAPWLISMLKDIVKAIGLGHNGPFKAIGIISNEMEKIEIAEIKQWLPELVHIERGKEEMLTDFLNKIKA